MVESRNVETKVNRCRHAPVGLGNVPTALHFCIANLSSLMRSP